MSQRAFYAVFIAQLAYVLFLTFVLIFRDDMRIRVQPFKFLPHIVRDFIEREHRKRGRGWEFVERMAQCLLFQHYHQNLRVEITILPPKFNLHDGLELINPSLHTDLYRFRLRRCQPQYLFFYFLEFSVKLREVRRSQGRAILVSFLRLLRKAMRNVFIFDHDGEGIRQIIFIILRNFYKEKSRKGRRWIILDMGTGNNGREEYKGIYIWENSALYAYTSVISSFGAGPQSFRFFTLSVSILSLCHSLPIKASILQTPPATNHLLHDRSPSSYIPSSQSSEPGPHTLLNLYFYHTQELQEPNRNPFLFGRLTVNKRFLSTQSVLSFNPHPRLPSSHLNRQIICEVVLQRQFFTSQPLATSFLRSAAQQSPPPVPLALSGTFLSPLTRNSFICQLNLNQHIIIKQYRRAMSNIDCKEFQDLIKSLSLDSLYKKAIMAAQKRYLVKHLGLASLHPCAVVKLITRNQEKSQIWRQGCSMDGCEKFETIWALNQFKIFTWVSVCYAFIHNRDLQNFITPDLLFLQSLFSRKSLPFLQYHVNSLLKESKNGRKKWNEDEEELLAEIVGGRGETLVWSEISFELYLKSQKLYFRTPQKCREKWFNHLSPEVNRNKWTLQEDIELFNNVVKHGPKWALISKLFNGSRTEHMTKNRYNSYVKKYQAKIQKTSAKKVIEKIQQQLAKKASQPYYELKKEEIEEQVEEEEEGESLGDVSQQASVGSSGKEAERETRQLVLLREGKRLNSFDLEQILFSEVKIEQPANNYTQIQLIEVQLYDHYPRADEYLSLLS